MRLKEVKYSGRLTQYNNKNSLKQLYQEQNIYTFEEVTIAVFKNIGGAPVPEQTNGYENFIALGRIKIDK